MYPARSSKARPEADPETNAAVLMFDMRTAIL
jgi:hypothetical protein